MELGWFIIEEWQISLISALLGSLVGGLVTYYFNKRHTEELEHAAILNLAKALRTELSALWNIYMSTNGNVIEKWDESKEIPPRIGLLDIQQNYFVIFDNSSNLLCLLKSEVSQKVVETYINLKGLTEELVYYGTLTKRFTDSYSAYSAGTSNLEKNIDEICTVEPQMNDHYKYLRTRHFEVKKLIEETTSMLDEVTKM